MLTHVNNTNDEADEENAVFECKIEFALMSAANQVLPYGERPKDDSETKEACVCVTK